MEEREGILLKFGYIKSVYKSLIIQQVCSEIFHLYTIYTLFVCLFICNLKKMICMLPMNNPIKSEKLL